MSIDFTSSAMNLTEFQNPLVDSLTHANLYTHSILSHASPPQTFTEFPCRQDAQKAVETPKERNAVFIDGRKSYVHVFICVKVIATVAGSEREDETFEQDELGCGIDPHSRRIRCLVDKNLVVRQVWSCKKNLNFERWRR